MSDDKSIDNELMNALDTDDDAALDAALRSASGLSADAIIGSDSEPTSDEGADAENDQKTGDDQQSAKDDAVDVAAKAEGEQPKAEGQDSQPAEKTPGADETAPVANKDGTGTIPYGVLKEQRRLNAELKSQLEEANRKIAEAAQAPAEGGEQTPAEAKATDRMQEAIASGDELSEADFEDLPPALQKLYAKVQQIQGKVDQVDATAQSVASKTQQQAAEETQALIDQFEDLSAWQASGGFMWDAARQTDNQLLADPEWQGKSEEARFKEVINRVRQGAGLEARNWDAAAKSDEQGSAGQQGVDPAKAGADVPASISHIPGGGAAPLDMSDSIERTSAAALAERMDGMNDDQIDALLAKFS